MQELHEQNQAAAEESRALMEEIEASRQRIGNAYAAGDVALGGGGFLVEKVVLRSFLVVDLSCAP